MPQLLHSLLQDCAVAIPAQLPDAVVTGLSCDSRSVAAGTLFIGLPGGRWMGAASGQQR